MLKAVAVLLKAVYVLLKVVRSCVAKSCSCVQRWAKASYVDDFKIKIKSPK